MGCLFGFSIAQARIILFSDLSSLEGFFVLLTVSGNSGTSIVGDIDVFGAAVAFAGSKGRMIGRTSVVVFFSDFLAYLQRATKFDPLAFLLLASSRGLHFQVSVT